MKSERINGPKISPIQRVILPEIDTRVLSNGIPVYILSGGTQEVLKLEIIIDAGRPYEHIRTAARTISSLLKEGTQHRSGEEIASQLEFYGASFNTSSDIDTCKITLYCLSQYFSQTIEIIVDVLSNASFPESELSLFKNNMKQRLEIDLMKNDVIAYRALTESLYGDDHPYGYNSTIENYSTISRADLVSEYKAMYGADRCKIFLSGRITPQIIEELNCAIENYTSKSTRELVLKERKIPRKEKIRLESPNPYQNALRFGRRMFNKKHEDYAGISVLSTLLGGYFGSRLMSNIREDKGYTYNIYAGLDTMAYDGYFYISTEVGTAYLEDTIVQIQKEIEILQSKLVPLKELTMVKNYMAGNYLSMLDGPLKSSRVIRNVICSDLELSSFDEIITKTLTISAEEIKDLANKYLNLSDMTEVIV